MDDAEKIRQAQNKLFKGIMKELLKREPVLEDKKRLSMCGIDSDPSMQYIFWDGVNIGSVKHDYENHNYKCVFNPK